MGRSKPNDPTKMVGPPGYIAKKPQYPAVLRLNQVSGSHDTILNLTEVALRFFESHFPKEGNLREFVDRICRELKVNASLGRDWSDVRGEGHRFSVARAMTITDSFLRRLAREYRQFKQLPDDKWISKRDGKQLDTLTALTENLPPATAKLVRRYPEYAVLQYYRAVRNRAIHRTSANTDALLREFLKKHKDHLEDHYGSIPCAFDDVEFGDFILLSRVIKYFAKVLNDACNLRVEDILFYEQNRQGSDFMQKARLCKGSDVKIGGFTRHFTLKYLIPEADAARLQQLIADILRKDPSKGVRKKSNNSEPKGSAPRKKK